MAKSRTEYVFKNAWIGIVAQTIALVLSFVSRTLFIRLLGNDYLGVNGLFTNILTLLSVAELGVGQAIIFNLYKPIANNDENKIKALVNFYKKAYRVIGISIFMIGLLVIPFMDLIIVDKPNIPENLNLIYVLFLSNTAISYLFNYKASILRANQMNYIPVTYKQIFHCIQLVVQILILYITHNYILYLVIQFLCTFLNNVLLSRKAAKLYPYINDHKEFSLAKDEKKDIFGRIKNTFLYKIGTAVLHGTDSIIISRYLGVGLVGITSNYSLIKTTIKKFLTQITSSFTASVGNLNATDEGDKREKVLFQIMYICFLLYAFCSTSIFVLSNDFISVWLGKEYTFELVTVALIMLDFYIEGMQFGIYTYRNTLGLHKYGRFGPILASIFNIVSSIALLKFMGINGVFLGTSLSFLLTYCWIDPRSVYKEGFKKSSKEYFKKMIKYFVMFIFIATVTYFSTRFIIVDNYFVLILKVLLTAIIVSTLIIIFTYNMEECKGVMKRVNGLFTKIKNKFRRKKINEN